MGELTIKMPDVGEGIAEAELVEWHVTPGDVVREDAVLAAVMTDKATVEIPSPADGKVLWLGAELNSKVAVGAPLIKLEVAGETHEEKPVETAPPPVPEKTVEPPKAEVAKPQPASVNAPSTTVARGVASLRSEGEKPIASPSVRSRAMEAGIDLRQVPGSGPAGRITHDDLEAFISGVNRPAKQSGLRPNTSENEVKVVGLRRVIAERMSLSKSRIPHITYVEEVDMTALEELREQLNRNRKADHPKLTILPFLMRAMIKAIADYPQFSARYDDDANIVHQYGGVHIGIATQTDTGLMVPVVRHSEALDIWGCASELNRVSEAARTGTARREELSGSTITISSLGALGGIVSTPVINYPEVAIIGINKIAVRPIWDGTDFVPRKIMNLSSSFDHRVIDGWDAAVFIQRIKVLLETPALIFVEE
ncbi:dihydrolipoamide acetyltransferase family protein [Microvirga sp. W0021]|uniref:Dihydrolipoamide acetyltransferase component of pyruvate dehydrogenase complex n=1 Tax=Hohaiivirga grylli TaxID=3133970 RepID=A0ABV0BGG1_9HYPH